jgi:hypothetical protein
MINHAPIHFVQSDVEKKAIQKATFMSDNRPELPLSKSFFSENATIA